MAAGVRALPGANQPFAVTQGMWRFLANPRVTLPALIEPPREAGRRAVAETRCGYALLAHDWSKLDYPGHSSKTDQTQLSRRDDIGYELYSALLVDADRGCPLAPMELELLCADGVHTTRQDGPAATEPHLTRLLPVMRGCDDWNLAPRLVHVIDREADSVGHFRTWHAEGWLFLVRANGTRKLLWRGQRVPLDAISARLSKRAFRKTRKITYKGKAARQFVAETKVVLDGPARPRGDGPRRNIPGEPLSLRLVIAQVRDAKGNVLAEWLLFSNVPAEITGDQIALWYYWRWRIESFFKLLKSHGQQVEHWQQESAEAIAKRLLVAAMACVTVWMLQQQDTPAAREFQRVLVRLSGRQMKRSRPVTAPALLAGLEKLIAVLNLLHDYTPQQLERLLQSTLPQIPWLDTG